MPGHFQVHKILDKGELEKFEAFTREKPARTIDECHEWLLALGHVISRSAVGAWKREFDLTDRFRASNDAARALVDAAKGGGVVSISDAAALQLQQMIFEQMIRLQGEEQVSTRDLQTLSAAMGNVVKSKRHLEKLKSEVSEALEVAEKEAKAGGSAEAVVSKVREILGIG